MITVKDICLYPVKSLRGFSVSSSVMSTLGLHYDRYWMTVDETGKFITQRQLPAMILIHTQLTPHELILTKTGMTELRVPLEQDQQNAKPFTATVWKDQCQVIDEGDTAAQWLYQALAPKRKIRLVRMAHNFQRPQSKPAYFGEQTSTHFADAAPFLICNQSSLNQLNRHLLAHQVDAITMERFRPNIILEGLDAFTEHKAKYLEHSCYVFKHCYPCQRCVIPTINIDTGLRHPQQQPFSLLAELNNMPNNTKAPAFGENAILHKGSGATIAVGDTLTKTL